MIFKTLVFVFLAIFTSASALAQDSRPPILSTVVNFGLHSADAAQTCWNLKNTRGWREQMLPSQSCAADASMIMGASVAAWGVDYWLRKHGHSKLAQFQWTASGGSAFGLWYTFSR